MVMVGPQAITEHRNRAKLFRATRHSTREALIMLKGDERVEFRVNLVAMHLWAEGHGDFSTHSTTISLLASYLGTLSGQSKAGVLGNW
jgi:hypothetical protein